MKGKKALAVLMTALILSATTVCTTTVSAYEDTTTVVSEASSTYLYKVGDDTFSYEIVDNTVAIKKYTGTSKNVVIPNEINGMPVTQIHPFIFTEKDTIVSITIPKNLKTILNADAFHKSLNIKEIIVDPDNSNFTSANGVLYNKNKTTLVYYPPAKDSTSFTIPSTVTEVGTSAFMYNKNLTGVTIPNSVTKLGWYAFYASESLTSVSLPDSITDMGVYSFTDSNKLTTAKLSKNAPVGNAFKSCKNLKNVTIPEGVTTMYQLAFSDCISLTEIKLPSTLTQIGAYAFANTGLKSITVPKSVTTINDYALGYDSALKKYVDNFVIYGYNGTEAERYAIESGISFSSIDAQSEVVKLNKQALTMGINESYTLKPTLSPSGTTTYKWKSSNTSVATVNSNGKITAKAEGTAYISVETAKGSVASCKITVKKAPTEISLNKSAITIGIGEQFDFNSSLPYGSASYSTVYSSSNPDVVSVKAGGGLATGKAVGTATITVKTYNGKTATCKVTVKKAPTKVSLNKSSVTLGIDDYIDLNSKLPSGEASRVVTYTSSDKSIATVNGSGLVKAKKLGTVTITAKTYNGKTTTCKITVKNSPTSITLNKSKITIGIGETFDFNSSIPSGTASYSRNFYSYSDNIVSIQKAGGLATGKSVGSTYIRVTTHNDKSAYADVTVKKAPTSISLNRTSATLGVGEILDLNSKLPSGEASRVVTYTSSDSNIATVKGAGIVTAKKPGTVTITATTYNGKTATCKITVKKAPTSVSLNKTSATLGVGETLDLNSKLPSGEASRVVTYTSSDSNIATVKGAGIVTAKNTGTVTITATTYNGKTATCKITVKKAPTSVSLNKTSATLKVGEILDLNSKLPSGEASRVVTYTSSDNSIATVKGAGIVTAKKPGTVTITATTYNGITATCKIRVR